MTELRKRSVLPGFELALGFTLLYLSLIVLIPLSATIGPTAGMFVRFAVGSGFALAIAWLSRRSLEEFFLRRGFAHHPR